MKIPTQCSFRRSASRTPHGAPCSGGFFSENTFSIQEFEKRRSDRLAYPRRAVNKHERTPPGRRHQRRGSVSVRGDARLYPSANCPMAVAKVNRNLLLRQPIATAIVRRWTSNRTFREGSRLRLAIAIGVAPAPVSQWRTGFRSVPAERCPLIERATKAPCAAKTSALTSTSIGPTCAERIKSRLMRYPKFLSPVVLLPTSFAPGGL